jgi:uncharacterized protein (TIGR03084 family)
MTPICTDLKAEYEALDALVATLDRDAWQTVTLCADWTVKDEIAHIGYFDAAARLAVTDKAGFARHAEDLFASLTSFDDFNLKTLADGRKMSTDELLTWWRRERSQLIDALLPLDPKDRIPWYGPPMSAKSFASARLMETWAHGQDVIDALKITRQNGDRLRHIAHIGVRTFGWSFLNRGMEVPDKPVRVDLTAPSGEVWTWGEEDSADRITGPAEDFCLVVVQRRHVDSTRLALEGDTARQWMLLAQAFAGPPDNGPPAGMYAKKNDNC